MKALPLRQKIPRLQLPARSVGGRRGLAAVASLGALVLLTMGAAACGGTGEMRKPGLPSRPSGGEGGESGEHPGMGGQGGSGAAVGVPIECEPGEQKDCTVYVQQASGVTSCWRGVRVCVDGEFSECLDPGSVAASGGG